MLKLFFQKYFKQISLSTFTNRLNINFQKSSLLLLFLSSQLHCGQFGFSNPEYSFEALRAIAATTGGGADIGECLETFTKITDSDDESWYAAWNSVAERLEKEAFNDTHSESAYFSFLRACNYYRTAYFFLDKSSEKAFITWKKSVDCFTQAIKGKAVEKVQIPFEEGFLPGYFLRVDSTTPKPLVILQTGFDGTKEELYITTGQAIVERGYNCLIFEGPGQGAVINEQKIPFRYNWETVITPVVDYAYTRKDIDKDKIALMGISFGGYLVPRALAFENRIKIGIVNGGIYDFHRVCMPKTEHGLEELLSTVEGSQGVDAYILQKMQYDASIRWVFNNGMYTFGAKTPAEWLKMTEPYTLEGITDKIQIPMLVIDSEGETFLKNQSKMFFDALHSPKQFLLFRKDEGAGAHCQVGAYFLSNGRVLNWIDEQFK